MNKKFLNFVGKASVSLLVLNTVFATNFVGATGVENTKDLVVLHTNDIHGRIEGDSRSVIGMAKLDAIADAEKAKTDQITLLVDAGDAFQGLPISNSTNGEAMAEIMNAVGYDAMAVGNHEFDFSLEQAQKYKQLLNFPLLSANTYLNGVRLFDASTIIDKDTTVTGDEFVVIGVTTPETSTKTHPKNVSGVEFRDPISEVNAVIKEIEAQAKAQGKEYKNYVILAHLGIDETTPAEWQGSTLAKALSENTLLTGKKVLVIDGHSHTVYSQTYGNVVYNQTGSYLNNIGKVTLANDGTVTPSIISFNDAKNVTPTADVSALVAAAKSKFDEKNADIVIDNNTVELNGDRENVRVRETNLGNVIADALYEYGQTGFSNKTDLAVTNGGGIRATIQKDKPVTKGDIIAVLPFGNIISQIEVTGEDIVKMFEHSLGSITVSEVDANGYPLLNASGGFLHISGAKVYYDTNKTVAEGRIIAIEILNKETGKYELINMEKKYYLATNDFLAAGGDGYTMLGGAREEGPSMDEVFAGFLKTADLTKYEKINPITRLITTNEYTRKGTGTTTTLPTLNLNEGSEFVEGNVPKTSDEVTSKKDKKKTLPNTGTETTSTVALGLIVLLSAVLLRKRVK